MSGPPRDPRAARRRAALSFLRDTAVGFVVFFATVLGGALVAWHADDRWWSAAVLVAEPLLLCAAALFAWRLLRRGHLAWACLFTLGVLVDGALVRFPWPGSARLDDPPPWIEQARRCAGAIDWPTAGFRLVQWTVDERVTPGTVAEVLRTTNPDVIVLHGRLSRDAEAPLHDGMDAEAVDGVAPFSVYTRNVLHICDDATSLSATSDAAPGYAVFFVGAADGASFPLLVGSSPGVEVGPAWLAEARAVRSEVGTVAGELQSSTLLVALDAHAPWTFTRLNARFAAFGLTLLPTAPDWPQALTMHPYGRLWAGPAWTSTGSHALRVGEGARAPVVTELGPVLHTARR